MNIIETIYVEGDDNLKDAMEDFHGESLGYNSYLNFINEYLSHNTVEYACVELISANYERDTILITNNKIETS